MSETAVKVPTLAVWTNDGDWIVAASAKEAMELWCDHDGENEEDFPEMRWERCPDDKPFLITYENKPDETRTFGEWAALNGEGFLASENF